MSRKGRALWGGWAPSFPVHVSPIFHPSVLSLTCAFLLGLWADLLPCVLGSPLAGGLASLLPGGSLSSAQLLGCPSWNFLYSSLRPLAPPLCA